MTRFKESIKKDEIETLISELTNCDGVLISKQTIINNCMRRVKASRNGICAVLKSMVSRGMLVSRKEGRKVYYINKLNTI